MHLDPALPLFALVVVVMLLSSLLLRSLKQPDAIAHILAGAAIGPWGMGLLTDVEDIERLGGIGIILLLFFVGMEISPHAFIKSWKISVLGTLLQIAASVGCALGLGAWFGWAFPRSLLVGFVISLSSTAVVLKLLEDRNEAGTDTGRDALGILLAQDILVVPMLMILAAMSGEEGSTIAQIAKQSLGVLLLSGIVGGILYAERVQLPFITRLREDYELQVFGSLLICFGFATITGFLELSSALGGFVAGMVVGAARETHWVHHSLHPFRVVFVSLFFLSVGMLVDLPFLQNNLGVILSIVGAAMVTNTLINALVIRGLGGTWRRSLYTGAVLAQIGEFGFVLVAMGKAGHIVSVYGYQLVLCAISVSLMVSPLWMQTMHLLVRTPKP